MANPKIKYIQKSRRRKSQPPVSIQAYIFARIRGFPDNPVGSFWVVCVYVCIYKTEVKITKIYFHRVINIISEPDSRF